MAESGRPPRRGDVDPLDASALLERVASEGFEAVAARRDLRPAEAGLIELLATSFPEEVPWARETGDRLRESERVRHTSRFRVEPGDVT